MTAHVGRVVALLVLVLLALCAQGCPMPRRQAPPRTAAEAPLGAAELPADTAAQIPVDTAANAPLGQESHSPEADPAQTGAGDVQALAKGVPIQRGRASYYADRFAGHSTASGERYDPNALTAAHRTLPFGAIVDVVRHDGRRVRVRINDRGPFARGKVIDLSRRAAQAIGLIQEGIAVVTIELVSRPPRRR